MNPSTCLPNALLFTNCLLLFLASVTCYSGYQNNEAQRVGQFAARRAADDSRPLSRIQLAQQQQNSAIVVGKFRAPTPERIQRSRIAKPAEFGAQTMSASFRVADHESTQPEKVVHGIVGSSVSGQRGVSGNNQRVVSAKIQVSDEGLNYPPSKLSADIYGNVAEIVTAPPEAVDNDFLLPASNMIFGSRRAN